MHQTSRKIVARVLLVTQLIFVSAYSVAPALATDGGSEGCTPGFWKQSQHFDSWTAPYDPGDQFSSVFDDAFPGKTLLQVLSTGGGGLTALGRHTVGALLNAASPDVDFAFTTGEVISMFNDAFPGGDYEALKNQFAVQNEKGCPGPGGAQPATLLVIKQVINDDEGANLASDFTLEVIGQNPSQTSFAGSEQGILVTLDAGAYSVDEADSLGYIKTLSDGCSGQIAGGQTKTCTITNNDQPLPPPEKGSLTVVKQVINDNGGQALVSDYILSVADSQQNSFVVVSGSDNDFDPGTYTVGESGGPTGYLATFSGDCNGQGQITIAANASYTCTITNDDIGPHLSVIKHVDNTGGGTKTAADFEILVDAANASPENFAGSESGVEVILSAGAYSVSEELEDDYLPEYSSNCEGTIALAETKTCTIVNVFTPPPAPKGSLKVIKEVINDNEGTAQASDFTLNVTDSQQNSFVVQSGQTNEFNPGAYTVGETGGPSGYTASFSGDCDSQGQISIEADEEFTCTITNNDVGGNGGGGEEEEGTLVVKKIVVNDNGGNKSPDDFSLFVKKDSENVAGSPAAGAESGTTYTLAPGEYTVGETAVNLYTASFSGDCNAEGKVIVVDDQQKVCTITNNDIFEGGGGEENPPPVTPPPSGGGGPSTGSGSSSGGGPSYQARLDFASVAEKTVGQNANESVIVTNTGQITINAGELKITFPGILALVSSNPAVKSKTGSVAVWDVPQIAPNGSFKIEFTVVGNTNAQAIVSVAQYKVSTNQLAQTSAVENVGSVAGVITPTASIIQTPPPPPAVKGEALPRTGASPGLYVVVLSLGLSAILYRRRLGHCEVIRSNL